MLVMQMQVSIEMKIKKDICSRCNWCRTDVEIKYKSRCSIYVAVDADVVVILRAGCSGGFQRQSRSSTLDPVDPRSSQCRSTMQILHGTSQPTIVAQILWSRPRNFASAHFDFQTDSDLRRLVQARVLILSHLRAILLSTQSISNQIFDSNPTQAKIWS